MNHLKLNTIQLWFSSGK